MNETTQRKLDSVKRFGIKARGKASLINHLKGKHISRPQAVEAKCYECNGYYADGTIDCNVPSCPLYPFNPYSADYRAEDDAS